MEKLKILLTRLGGKKPVRRRRRDLAQFFEVLGLFLQVGSDLASAWKQASVQLSATIDRDLAGLLDCTQEQSYSDYLQGLALKYPDPRHRLWFQVLAELYTSGAPMKDIVLSAADFLKEEHTRDIDLHCQNFPRRAQLYLLMFFLPPAFFLLFAPLLLQLTKPW